MENVRHIVDYSHSAMWHEYNTVPEILTEFEEKINIVAQLLGDSIYEAVSNIGGYF